VYTGPHSLDEEHGTGSFAVEQRATQGRQRSARHFSGIKEIIAVTDFAAKEVSSSLAINVSELIRTELINSGRYTVIERSQMKEILKEQGFQQTERVHTDVNCAVRMGKLLSAKKILVGSVMKMGSRLIISGRVVDVEKGIGERAVTGKANSIDQLDRGVTEFVDAL
jgi:curli biogenesis system outer membrane secretion channel CsgG